MINYEAASLAIISGFAVEIYKDVKSLGDKLGTIISNQIQADIGNYLKERTDRNIRVKTLIHSSIPVDFYSIYEPLGVYTERYRLDLFDCKDVFKNGKYFTFFGAAGCGKTTFFKHLELDCINNKVGIPVTLFLRTIKHLDFVFLDLIKEELKIDSIDVVNILLKRGKIVLFLDGYDETSTAIRKRFIGQLRHFTKQYPEIKILISSRPGSGIKFFEEFINLNMNSFTVDQSLSFVRRQLFNKEPIHVSKICSLVEQGMNRKEISEYLHNPLLLNIFMVTMDHKHEIPDNINDFYQRILDALFFKHDQESKPDLDREFKTKLTNSSLTDFLNRFSLITHMKSTYSFGAGEVDTFARLVDKNNFGKTYQRQDLIYDLECSVSLWTEVDGRYQFAHRSLQEFLACREVLSFPESQKEKFYTGPLYVKVFSDEQDNFRWTDEFLEKTDSLNYIKFFKLINLRRTENLLRQHVRQRSDLKDFIDSLVLGFEEFGIIFDSDFYLLLRYSSSNLMKLLSSIEIKYLNSEFPKDIENDHIQNPSNAIILEYLSQELDEFDIDLDLKESLRVLSLIISETEDKLKKLSESYDDILNLIGD